MANDGRKKVRIKERLTKKQILTVPNALSLFRFLLIPLILWLYFAKEMFVAVLITVIISGITDILDGVIARKYNCMTDLGKVIDPLADKLTQWTLMICLISRYPWIISLLSLHIIKELAMLAVGTWVLNRTDSINSAKWYGKATTVVLYCTMAALIIFPGIPEFVANILVVFCAASIIVSMILYMLFYAGILKAKRASDKAVTENKNESDINTSDLSGGQT